MLRSVEMFFSLACDTTVFEPLQSSNRPSLVCRCLLELLLRRRGGAILAMLTRATEEGKEEEAEEVLRKSLTAVQRTILDVYTIFAPRPSGECWVVELAQSSHITAGSLTLAPHKVKELCTKWLTVLTPKIRSFSKHLLSGVGNTNTLARIRGALWGFTHGPGAWVAYAPEQYSIGLDNGSIQNMWTTAVAFAIDVSAFGDGAGMRETAVSPSLNLWALFFGNIFVELAEALLKDSLLCIRRDVEHRLDSILLAITGSQAGGPREDDASDHLNCSGQQTGALMAHQVLAASEAVVSLLTSELRHLSEDAWRLTERGDEAAADALRNSFYLLCVDMAAGLANHFRIALQEIRTCIKGAAKKEHGLASDGGLREREDVVRSLTDAALVVGRVAWMLNGRSGRPLQSALTCPDSFAKRLRGRIEQQQLEAAFVIADTDGDGIVDVDEAAEALQAVSFGSCAELVLDPAFSSLTLTEFILFATRLLDEQRPLEHLTSCLDDLLVEALAAWAEWALERPAELLASGCNDFAALCRDSSMTDSLWRQTHGIWEETTIELDRDDGHGVEETIHSPVMISPALLCYIEGVAAELGRILSTSDLVAARSAIKHTADGTHGPQTEGDERRAEHNHLRRNDGLQETAHRTRSLAAARASSDLKKALLILCDGPHSAAAQACEAAHLQLLLDALFLQKWVSDDDSSPSTQSIVDTLSDLMDPINLQIYLPHLERAASVCWSACYTSLSLIFEEVTTQGIFVSAASMTPGGAVGSSSSFVALAPKVRRFEILPLPLDAVRLLPANAKQRVGSSPAQASSGEGEEHGGSSSAQSRGMQAGRQALAGLMDQVGSVGSVLSAQNVNVQSVLGAASLFLGGRTRRGDGEEFREF